MKNIKSTICVVSSLALLASGAFSVAASADASTEAPTTAPATTTVSTTAPAATTTAPAATTTAPAATTAAATTVKPDEGSDINKAFVAKYGDVNFDGKITAEDATFALIYFAESLVSKGNIEPFSEYAKEYFGKDDTKTAVTTTVTEAAKAANTADADFFGDVNGDGKITAEDATAMLIYFANDIADPTYAVTKAPETTTAATTTVTTVLTTEAPAEK